MAQQLARQMARRIPHYFRSPTAFHTVQLPYCLTDSLADGSADGLPDRTLLPLVDNFPDVSRTGLLDEGPGGWLGEWLGEWLGGWLRGWLAGSHITSICM